MAHREQKIAFRFSVDTEPNEGGRNIAMKKLLIFVMTFTLLLATVHLVPSTTAQASGRTTYYVDSSEGNDSNSGTSINSPWKSLSKVNSFVFQPGDEILFKAGSSWNGVLQPQGSGNSSAQVEMLKKKLCDGQLAVTDAQIKKYYDENKAIMYKNSNGTILPLSKVKNHIVNSLRDEAYSNMIDQLVKNSTVKINEQVYQTLQNNFDK